MKRASSKVLSLLPLFAQVNLSPHYPTLARFAFRAAISTYATEVCAPKSKPQYDQIIDDVLKNGIPHYLCIAGKKLKPLTEEQIEEMEEKELLALIFF